DKDKIFALQQAYKVLFDKTQATFAERIEQVAEDATLMANELVAEVIEFVRHPSKNNILQPE
ncbi:MAG: hypothetical protein ACI4QM_04180, partial [Alphaproteobacteria bacterium]